MTEWVVVCLSDPEIYCCATQEVSTPGCCPVEYRKYRRDCVASLERRAISTALMSKIGSVHARNPRKTGSNLLPILDILDHSTKWCYSVCLPSAFRDLKENYNGIRPE